MQWFYVAVDNNMRNDAITIHKLIYFVEVQMTIGVYIIHGFHLSRLVV